MITFYYHIKTSISYFFFKIKKKQSIFGVGRKKYQSTFDLLVIYSFFVLFSYFFNNINIFISAPIDIIYIYMYVCMYLNVMLLSIERKKDFNGPFGLKGSRVDLT